MSSRAFLVGFVAVMVLGLFPQTTEAWSGKCIHVADGDTITVLNETGEGKKQVVIRLWGIDCPEGGQAFGHKAKSFTHEMVHGKIVEVELAGDKIDKYGRTVALVRVDGVSLNHELVKAGMAWWYVRYAPQEKELQRLESEAQNAKRGLWGGTETPLPPWEYRRLKPNYATEQPSPQSTTPSAPTTQPNRNSVPVTTGQPIAPVPTGLVSPAPVVGGGAPGRSSLDKGKSGGPVHVKEYEKKDGTVVKAHDRSTPSGGSRDRLCCRAGKAFKAKNASECTKLGGKAVKDAKECR